MIFISIAFMSNADKVKWALYDVPGSYPFYNGVAAVRYNGHYELMSNSGEIITDKQFKMIDGYGLKFGYCIAKNAEGEEGIINIKGDWILPPSNKYKINFCIDYAAFIIKNIETNKSAIFTNGHFITPFKYDRVVYSHPIMICEYGDIDEAVNIKTEDIIQGTLVDNGDYTKIEIKDDSGQPQYLYYDSKTGERISSKDLLTSKKNISIEINGKELRLVYADSKIPLSDATYYNSGHNIWVNNRLIVYGNNNYYVFDESGQELLRVNNSVLLHYGQYIFTNFIDKYYDYNGNLIEDATYMYCIDGHWYSVRTANGKKYLYNAKKNKKYEYEFEPPSLYMEDGMIRGELNGKPCYFNTETEKIIGPFNVIS